MLLGAPASALGAEGVPAPPALYYGTVQVTNGARTVPLPAGTRVTALANGQEAGSLVTEEEGKYGGPALSDLKLMAGGSGDIADGATISFLVGGVAANETAVFHSLDVMELNLTVTDNQGPSVTAVQPANGNTVASRRPTIAASFSDDIAGIDRAWSR